MSVRVSACQCVCRVLTGVTIQYPLDVRFCPMLQVRVIACCSDLNMLRSSNFATTRIVMDVFVFPEWHTGKRT